MVAFVFENSLVQWLAESAAVSDDVAVGIGDDAAVLNRMGTQSVLTTDLICDGTHFESEQVTASQIGRKAMAVNLSDIAAMAAEPVAAFVSLLAARNTSQQYLQELMMAARQLASGYGCVLAGGDTNVWDGRLVVNVAVIGRATERGPLLRAGAKPGDVLLVTGSLGGSIGGHHLEFAPRIHEAQLLHRRYKLNAGMDISDGLAIDLRRLGAASGCGAVLNSASIPVSDVIKRTVPESSQQQLRALGDGEDFELLLAASPSEADRILRDQPLDVPVTAIGRCVEQREFWLVDGDRRIPLPSIGYEHGLER